MNNLNYKKYLMIFLGFIFSYGIASILIKNVFLADSPKIRPNLSSYVLAKINTAKENILARLNFNLSLFSSSTQTTTNNIAENQNDNQFFNLLRETAKPITKGVSASTRNGYTYYQYNVNNIEWATIEYTLKNGQTVKISYPKGTEPPPKEIYENY